MKLSAKSLLFGAASVALLGLAAFIARQALKGNPSQPLPRSSLPWLARHQLIVDRLQQGRPNLLWIGDSIVQRFEGPGTPVWDRYYAPRDAVNMGVNGDHTEHALWRLQHSPLDRLAPKLAIVMIGENNDRWCSPAEIAGGVSAIINTLRRQLPDTKILLLGIFFRGQKPDRERITLTQTNDLLARLADGQHIFYLNINHIFLNPDGTIRADLMPDFEHPNEEGCRAWAQAIEPQVAHLLGESPISP